MRRREGEPCRPRQGIDDGDDAAGADGHQHGDRITLGVMLVSGGGQSTDRENARNVAS